MTVLEVIQKSAEFLTRKGVDSPRLQAELLLAQVLKLPRMKLYLNFERELTDSEADEMRELVRRRGTREPLQHILGSVSFCGLEIAVNQSVLVPRPETELLAEAGWQFLSTRAPEASAALDFGTGSGCIAIAIAAKCLPARVTAVDVSAAALAVARANAQRHGVEQKIEFIQANALTGLPSSVRYDLVVSNPPYIPHDEIGSLQPEVRDFDPPVALDGGADGLDFYRRLAVESAGILKPDGRLMLEFGDGQAEKIKSLLAEQMWIVEAVRADYSQRQRILIARR